MAERRQMDRVQAVVERMIRELTKEGEDRLPPETTLSEQLGVSRATLREALSQLEADGRIERRRKRGTTIVPQQAPSVRYPANIIASFSDFLAAAGIEHELRELSVSRLQGNAVPASWFSGDGAEVVRSMRAYDVNGAPAAFLCHLLPSTIHGTPLRLEEWRGDIVPFLEQVQGVQIGTVTSAITAEGAVKEMAQRLGLEPGEAMLVMYTRVVDVDGATLALGALAFNPNVVTLTVEAHEHLTARHQSDLPLGWLRDQIVAAKREENLS